MASQKEIKAAMDRIASVYKARPSQAQVVRSAVCEVTEGVKCTIQAEGFTFTADMPEPRGDNTAPTPGTLVRGGLGACLAVGYALAFARHELPWTKLKVEIQADMDMRGTMGIDSVPPEFPRVRYIVRVESPADTAAIREAIEEANSFSPELANFANPIPIEGEVHINEKQMVAD
jgi:uncharacterized OsmC-like protein